MRDLRHVDDAASQVCEQFVNIHHYGLRTKHFLNSLIQTHHTERNIREAASCCGDKLHAYMLQSFTHSAQLPSFR